MAENILLYLLHSQLLMPAARWQQLIDALCAVHAVIQVLFTYCLLTLTVPDIHTVSHLVCKT